MAIIFEKNPFVVGRPVRDAEFINRGHEVRTILNHIYNKENTAIVGEPHVGKSSLLKQVANTDTLRKYFGVYAENIYFSFLDMHMQSPTGDPKTFWSEVLEPLDNVDVISIRQQLTDTQKNNYSQNSLKKLFSIMGDEGKIFVLFLDEFDYLFSLPNFQNSYFYLSLRSLASNTNGFALVTASRLSVSEMNHVVRNFSAVEKGSPCFNIMVEEKLKPFEEDAVIALLSQAGKTFTNADKSFIRRLAGRNPYLLQAMASTLWSSEESHREAKSAEKFYERVYSHFDDLWDYLDEETRTVAIILSLLEFSKNVLGSSYACGEIEQVDKFGPELKKLEEKGLADRVGEGNHLDLKRLIYWRGEQWTISCQAFTWWARDTVILENRNIPSYDRWLQGRKYKLFLTEDQWNFINNSIKRVPEAAVRSVSKLASDLLVPILKGVR